MTRRHARLDAELILRLTRSQASGAMWATVSALLLHADAEGRCFPSLSTIGTVAGLERRTVTRALRTLEDRGVIKRERHGRTPTHYTVLLGTDMTLEVGAQTPLEVGAEVVGARDETVPEVGADTPPELKILTPPDKKVLTGAPPSDRLPAGPDDEPTEEKRELRRAANEARRQQMREAGICV